LESGTSSGARRVLLIVDDKPFMGRALARVMKYKFDQVLIAHDPDQALEQLGESRVTHLVCDCNLGPRFRLGIEYIAAWRRLSPSIERAIVYSGTDLNDVETPPEVDQVLPKTTEPKELLEALGVDP
jgi:DNA-binding NarL/FixJ family response regulator